MEIRKTASALIFLTALAGCEQNFQDTAPIKKPKPIEFIVLEIGGTIADRQKTLVESSGAVFGNESVKIERTFALKVKDEKGRISYLQAYNNLDAAAMALKPGIKFRVLTQYSKEPMSYDDFYDSVMDRGRMSIGQIDSGRIQVNE